MSKGKTEEYQGPGRFTSAVGRGEVESTLASLGAGVVTVPLAIKGIGEVFEKDPKDALEFVEGLAGNKKYLAAAVIGGGAALAGLAHGARKGWTNASKGKAQHDELATQVEKLTARDELRHDISESTRSR